jgi:uncharacterized protein YggE
VSVHEELLDEDRVLSISETPQESSPVYRYAEAAADKAGAAVPIEQGSQELQLSVSVVYEISG